MNYDPYKGRRQRVKLENLPSLVLSHIHEISVLNPTSKQLFGGDSSPRMLERSTIWIETCLLSLSSESSTTYHLMCV